MRSVTLLSLSSLAASAALDRRDSVPPGYVAPPYYPTPHGGWVSEWSESYRKAALLVKNMTLAEKTNITSGTGIFMGRCVGNTGSALRVGIPQLCLQDGPLGVRNTDHNTAFPPGITVGATWDKDLMRRRGVAIGEEFRGKGVNIHLGPSVGALGRKPRGGRNWEGFGSDPVLQAFGGALTIEGIQSAGVIATIKHLIANEQETYRMYNLVKPGISSNLDDRTMHELYLWPFAEGVRAGVGSVMISYNAVNGSAAAQNSYLMNGLLKDELGFQGFVMSDWLAQISGVPSALAGLDMSMPGDRNEIPLLGNSYWMYDYSRAILNGSVPVDRLNDAVTRILAAYFQMGQDQNYPSPNFDTNTQDAEGPLYPGALFSPKGVVNEFVDVQGSHAEVAREVARDAITLLKNQDSVLPLSRNASLKIFGTDAEKNPDGINSCADQGCNKGTLGMGWGSGTARYPYMDSPIDGFKSRGSNYQFFNTDSFPSNSNPSPNDTAIVFVTADSGENYITVEGNPGDRTSSNLNLWHNGDKLIQDVAAKYSNVVVVVHTVGPIIMEAWHDLPSIKAVLFAHLPGQEAGKSLMEVLYGDVSPSGHLPYTVPTSENNYPASVSLVGYQLGQPQDTHTEGLYVDYRHFNKEGITPRYAFGYGLSYTSFSFSDASIRAVTPLTSVPPNRPVKGATPAYLTAIPPASEAYWPENFNRIWRYLYPWLEKNDADDAAKAANSSTTYPYPAGYSKVQKPGPAAGGAQGGNPALFTTAYDVSITVTNTGARAGKAVAQLYIQFPQGLAVDIPVIQLRDFEKTSTLQPGASQTLSLRVTRKDLSVWDAASQNWLIPSVSGDYGIWDPAVSVSASVSVSVPVQSTPSAPVSIPGGSPGVSGSASIIATASLPVDIPGSTLSTPGASLPDVGSVGPIQSNPGGSSPGASVPASVPAVPTPSSQPAVSDIEVTLTPGVSTPVVPTLISEPAISDIEVTLTPGVSTPVVPTLISEPAISDIEVTATGEVGIPAEGTPISEPAVSDIEVTPTGGTSAPGGSAGPVQTTPVSTSETGAPTSTPSVPTVIDTPDGSYSGCYEDVDGTGVSLFDGPSIEAQSDLTLESCQAFCTTTTGGPYRYFGLESGVDCRCGNSYQHSAIPYDGTDTDCNTSCSGDPSQKCGANNRLSVYANNDFLAAPVQVDPSSTPVPTSVSVTIVTPVETGPGGSLAPIETTVVGSATDAGSAAPIQTTTVTPSSTVITSTVVPSDSGAVAPIQTTTVTPSSTLITSTVVPIDSGAVAPAQTTTVTPSSTIITSTAVTSDTGIVAPNPIEPVTTASDTLITSSATPTDFGAALPNPNPGPTPVRLPLLNPFPNRPPSEAGDGVDAPYFNNAAWAPRPYPPDYDANKPTQPRPTKRPQENNGHPVNNGYPVGNQPRPYPAKARPTATREPWKPRPTVRPWEGGNGYRAERRWFGLW